MTMQHTLRKGQRQRDPTLEQIRSECLAIRSEWTFSQRVSAMVDATVARLQPDWREEWDKRLEHQEGQHSDATEF